MRLVELAVWSRRASLTVEEHVSIASAVLAGHTRAEQHVETGRVQITASFHDFAAAVLFLHDALFSQASLAFSGAFRRKGEPPVYYGIGRRVREGFAPELIEQELRSVHAQIARIDFERVERHRLLRESAIFLEHFFRVHPFHDGNGRIARLLLRAMARQTRRFDYDWRRAGGDLGDDYVEALEYAHGRVEVRDASRRDPTRSSTGGSIGCSSTSKRTGCKRPRTGYPHHRGELAERPSRSPRVQRARPAAEGRHVAGADPDDRSAGDELLAGP